MKNNGMFQNLRCPNAECKAQKANSLTLLSEIPNQRIYRCNHCQSFLCYHEDLNKWEVLLRNNLEAEIKDLYMESSN